METSCFHRGAPFNVYVAVDVEVPHPCDARVTTTAKTNATEEMDHTSNFLGFFFIKTPLFRKNIKMIRTIVALKR